MDGIDIGHLKQWVGREDRQADVVTPGLVERFHATLGASAFHEAGEAPLAIHWCLSPPSLGPDALGPDGHPVRGGFLPPVPLPRRMWAGGQLDFHAPLQVGAEVTRVSRIADVAHKAGRSGELVFVTVEHAIESDGRTMLSERQDIVYRPAAEPGLTSATAPRQPLADPRKAEVSDTVDATTTLLFRYSALTFNGHRIHYDVDYARQAEGYPGLVVHGPLQATLMLHLAARMSGGRTPRRFAYRGVAPLFHGAPFTVNAAEARQGLELWCADAAAHPTMTATAVF
ncbi:protein dehydratase [Aquibium carbonis]|uniref:Protein dehydratase n=1 Tax=Aquibium carbonis TaxID=2495581 RepID=A0A3R9ZWJ0_9HYPH|nr:MaoC family dehydratase N-terminal domain-containing protein [Aquibium carbonis]RST83484.1 protein dehydratase [Aquibium carbonis]